MIITLILIGTKSIDDSDSENAQIQKYLVKTMMRKGFTDTEILLEIQRVYGNDCVTEPDKIKPGNSMQLLALCFRIAFINNRFKRFTLFENSELSLRKNDFINFL